MAEQKKRTVSDYAELAVEAIVAIVFLLGLFRGFIFLFWRIF